MKFKYTGERPIIDMGLAFRKKDGANINLKKDCIIYPNNILKTDDDECITILTYNPHYEEVVEEVKPKKEKIIKNDEVKQNG